MGTEEPADPQRRKVQSQTAGEIKARIDERRSERLRKIVAVVVRGWKTTAGDCFRFVLENSGVSEEILQVYPTHSIRWADEPATAVVL